MDDAEEIRRLRRHRPCGRGPRQMSPLLVFPQPAWSPHGKRRPGARILEDFLAPQECEGGRGPSRETSNTSQRAYDCPGRRGDAKCSGMKKCADRIPWIRRGFHPRASRPDLARCRKCSAPRFLRPICAYRFPVARRLLLGRANAVLHWGVGSAQRLTKEEVVTCSVVRTNSVWLVVG